MNNSMGLSSDGIKIMIHSELPNYNTSNAMAEFDAVYPYHGDNHFEITHSIRLLRKHGKGLRNIYIVGDNPQIENTIHIPFIQEDAKEINIWAKVLAACFHKDLSERFLFMNDDHFILQDFEDIPYYYEGEIGGHSGNMQYSNAEDRTKRVLIERKKTVKYFDIHVPMFIEAEKFITTFVQFSNDEYIMKSAYCNFNNIKGFPYTDQKFRTLVSYDEAAKAIEGRFCFSTDNQFITTGLQQLILQL